MTNRTGQKASPPNPFFKPKKVYEDARQGLALTNDAEPLEHQAKAREVLTQQLLSPRLPLLRP